MTNRLGIIAIALLLAGCVVTSIGTSSSGISHPVGPSLAEFRVRDRCGGQDNSCTERAQQTFDAIVGSLGPELPDTPISDPDAAPVPGRLAITFDSDPPFEWEAVDGATGTAPRVVIDVTGALRGTESYAVVGPGLAYEVDAQQAEDLLFALFVLTD